jgi:hypothetical protein
MVADLDGKGIAPRSLMQAQQPETTSDQDRVGEPVFEIEELISLAQRESFILRFPLEALNDVGVAETQFEARKSRSLVGCKTRASLQVRNQGLCHANTKGVIRKAASRIMGIKVASGQPLAELSLNPLSRV